MLFSSLFFLLCFLPVTVGGYYLLNLLKFIPAASRIKVKNGFLLLMSLIFYAWGGLYYLAIMIGSILLNYLGGLWIGLWAKDDKARKTALIVTVVLNLALLFFFKYFNLLVACIEAIMELPHGINTSWELLLSLEGTGALNLPLIVLPIGISFFTFQAMSYVIDTYRKTVNVQKNIAVFALYVSLFPQLIAGPIVQYKDIEAQLSNRHESLELFSSGAKRFCYGLGKKVLIANTLAVTADRIWALETGHLGAPVAWLGLLSYALQIYYDFSGYSDMAIGLGKIFAFDFKENFNYPYLASSVQNFWQRWHISLSTWFRDYVYIPLGGNRKGLFRTCLNVFIVFLLTGVWHGANFTFLLWGIYYALFQILERLFLRRVLDKNPFKLLNNLYTLFVVFIGWVLFRSDNVPQAFTFIGQLFTASDMTNSVLTYLDTKVILALIAGLLFTGFFQTKMKQHYESMKDHSVFIAGDILLQLVILALCILQLVGSTYNPFIYFQF